MSNLETWKCCLCGATCTGWGNNPWPLNKDDNARCCDSCNNKVIEARLATIYVNGRKEK